MVNSHETRKRRINAMERQNGICYWCGFPIRKPTLEHLIPKSKGGGGGVVAACLKCNGSKGDRTPKEYIRHKLIEFKHFLKSEGFKKFGRTKS